MHVNFGFLKSNHGKFYGGKLSVFTLPNICLPLTFHCDSLVSSTGTHYLEPVSGINAEFFCLWGEGGVCVWASHATTKQQQQKINYNRTGASAFKVPEFNAGSDLSSLFLFFPPPFHDFPPPPPPPFFFFTCHHCACVILFVHTGAD